ncbi:MULTISPECIES: PucC family protein [unclassified Iodidimonas]|jgi:BCD family chlorophyll transporter-like MFS transporter|nr:MULTISPECIES: PucC family protein [unclassified Iodidimonas]
MSRQRFSIVQGWTRIGTQFLPFADAATADLPLPRLLRLALFQISVGMAFVLLNATLNRVMIVELGVPASLVAIMIALPLVFAPLRALIGHRSDHHRSFLGWKRVPYIWMGSLLQFGGFAIMPFALLILSGDTHGPILIGQVGAALAFLLVGAGLHITQTTGLALATDLAPEASRPRVVALLYVMLLLGMVASALIIGALLEDFSQLRLIQVVQGAAVITILLNLAALWKQEARDPSRTAFDQPRIPFQAAWKEFVRENRPTRLLTAIGLGAAAFAMQDILLEPYGGEILGLSVSATTSLTALLAGGTLVGFFLAARALDQGDDACRIAAFGAIIGLVAFPLVILSQPFQSVLLFQAGTTLIGLGGGLFGVGSLTAAMALAKDGQSGLALGAFGAVQATATGLAISFGGLARDVIGHWAESGALGAALNSPATGYMAVYHIEIILIFATLIAIGPLVRHSLKAHETDQTKFGLGDFPG